MLHLVEERLVCSLPFAGKTNQGLKKKKIVLKLLLVVLCGRREGGVFVKGCRVSPLLESVLKSKSELIGGVILTQGRQSLTSLSWKNPWQSPPRY